MERIKKALERAQEQRQETESQEQSSDDNNTSSADRSMETHQIAYSKTRSIDVSAELLEKMRVVTAFDDDPRSDLYKILRTKILQKMRANNLNLLAVTSPKSGAGKSLTSVNLAMSIAMDANFSVLLVDLDLRNPTIHEYFGISAEPGLSDYYTGDKAITEILVHPGLEKMVVLPAGSTIKRSSDLLSTPKMMELANELKQRYPDRIVVVDLPPLLQTDDAMIFMPNVDACVLVVAEGENTEEEVRKCIQLIDKEKYLGTILNKSAEVDAASEAY